VPFSPEKKKMDPKVNEQKRRKERKKDHGVRVTVIRIPNEASK